MPDNQKGSNEGTEELTRKHWQTLLRDNNQSRISIWYYNLDPDNPISQKLHDLLSQHCDEYANSKTPLLNAEFFEPNHFQPWIAKQDMHISNLIPVQTMLLTRNQIGEWLNSYSFRPNNDKFERVVKILQKQWFDKFQQEGYVQIPYVGVITQGSLRPNAFPIANINDKIFSWPLTTTPQASNHYTPRPKL